MTPNFDIGEESQLEGWSGFNVCLVHPPESHEQMIHQSEFYKISFFIYSTGGREAGYEKKVEQVGKKKMNRRSLLSKGK